MYIYENKRISYNIMAMVLNLNRHFHFVLKKMKKKRKRHSPREYDNTIKILLKSTLISLRSRINNIINTTSRRGILTSDKFSSAKTNSPRYVHEINYTKRVTIRNIIHIHHNNRSRFSNIFFYINCTHTHTRARYFATIFFFFLAITTKYIHFFAYIKFFLSAISKRVYMLIWCLYIYIMHET